MKRNFFIFPLLALAFSLCAAIPSEASQVPHAAPDGDDGRQWHVIERVSVSNAGAQANQNSFIASASSDGRYIAFDSLASNLVDGDTNGHWDVFVFDGVSGVTERVSVGKAGVEAGGDSIAPSISGNGRYVAFESYASNLVEGDTNGWRDVFVHDRVTKVTERVSLSGTGVQADGESMWASISGDGRHVAFTSYASNLVAGDTNGWEDVFVHDRVLGVTDRMSVSSSGAQANQPSESGSSSISGDGRYVVFDSNASNLVAGDANGRFDVFVHDRVLGVTERVSVSSAGVEANSDSYRASISSDGSYVSFTSVASNLVDGDTNDVIDAFLHDRISGVTERVSVSSAGVEANRNSFSAPVSGDGRYIAFESVASNLVDGDTNGWTDVFVRDRISGVTKRVSVSGAGDEADGDSGNSSVSGDGCHVTFTSDASNLVDGDTNGYSDMFLAVPGVFADVCGSVFETDIEWLAGEGITEGCNPPLNTRFCPSNSVSRGQMAAFLVRALGLTDDGGGNLFVDDDDSVFETDIDRLATAGITRGCDPPTNDRFCPRNLVTRGQMAAFLVRALAYTDDGGGDLFVDDDGSIFEADIDKLATAGVTRGCNPPINDRFCPNSYVTRGQMAAFLHRALGVPLALVGGPLPWGRVGHAYDTDVRATGGVAPYEFRITAGNLPAGLTLDSTGRISGVPLAEGSASITVAVTDRRGTESERAFDLYIAADALIGFMQITPLGEGRTSTQICMVEPDGSNESCVPGLAGALHSMTWSPDQSQIAFAAYIGGQTDLFVMNADGSDMVRITDDDTIERNPAFSPSGMQIAFARGSYSQTDIWVIDTDGGNATQLTLTGRGITGPTWSPDGSSIAFATFRDYEDYDAEIYVMDADGSNQRPLIRRDVQDRNPDWSPDGTLITFDTHGNDVGQFCNAVFVVDADGTNPRFVACGVEPAFSPDGTEIVYSSWWNRPPGPGLIEPADILVVGIDGTNKRCVSCSEATTEVDPDW